MDIVKPVERVIEGYTVGNQIEGSQEIAAIMNLFSIPLLENLTETGTYVSVDNKVIAGERPTVITEICLYEKGNQRRLIKRGFGHSCLKSEYRRLIRLHIFVLLKLLTGKEPSRWGILEGVRPTKIVHKLIDAGVSASQLSNVFASRYEVSSEKAALVTEVALTQRKRLNADFKSVSIYIGIPYCPTRCLYCSFPGNVLPGEQEVIRFMAALSRDIQSAAELIRNNQLTVDAVYVGGGTPTSLPVKYFEQLLSLIQAKLLSSNIHEFTVEAGRPDSLDDQKIALMSDYHVTRISLNPQTMNDGTLRRIGRKHTVSDIISMFGKIRNQGIPIINMDIIAGLPGETTDDMKYTMQKISELAPEQVTVHTLAIKRGSKLKENLWSTNLPDVRTTSDMVSLAHLKCRAMGLVPYYLYRQHYMTGNLENVGFTLPGAESIYNINIMEERQTIIGIGPAASTKAVNMDTLRLKSTYHAKDVASYISHLDYHINKRRDIINQLFDVEAKEANHVNDRSQRY